VTADDSPFLAFYRATEEVPEVDLDFAKLVGTLPKMYVDRLGETSLPEPRPELLRLGTAELFERRQSTREFARAAMPLVLLSTLLHYAVGVRGFMSAYGFRRFPLRTFPSAGNLMPTEVYVVPIDVEGLNPYHVYHYNAIAHRLDCVSDDRGRGQALENDAVGGIPELFDVRPAVCITLTTRFGAVEEKYSARGGRFVLLDAGVVIENVYLAATALGVGVVAVGGMHDSVQNDALRLDPRRDREAPIATMLLGLPAESQNAR
jgi:SagB-type dehydrogenase family enzyme